MDQGQSNGDGVVVTSRDPVGLAQEFKAALGSRVYSWGGEYWVWGAGEGRWARRTTDRVKKHLWRWLATVQVAKPQQGGGEAVTALRLDGGLVANVAEALGAITELDVPRLPVWLGEGTGPFRDPGLVVTCEDVLIDMGASAKEGQLRMIPRGPEWLDPVVVRVRMGAGNVRGSAEWSERVKVWGDGDPRWVDLCERWMGYTLLGTRKFQRWCLQVGKSGAGKGVLTRLWKDLCGGGGYMGTSWEELSGQFGMDGLEAARFLVIAEGGESVEKSMRGKMGSVLKIIVGQDTFTVNKKYGAKIGGLVSGAAVMVQANATPHLDDGAAAITSKMLVLPYRVGHRGTEDLGIGDRLRAEGPGVVLAWLEGAGRLLAASEGERWPVVDEGEVAEEMRGRGGLVDQFLDAKFVRQADGWVHGEMVRRLHRDWMGETGHSLGVDEKYLLGKVEREGTWDVRRGKRTGGGPRGLKGLVVRGV